MNEWTNKRMNEWMNIVTEQTNEWAQESMNEQMNEWQPELINDHMNEWMNE